MRVEDIARLAQAADEEGLAELERRFADDGRKGVAAALSRARSRLDAKAVEEARLESLYAFERDVALSRRARCVVGVDEVGRGPLAGPLAAGAVVLDPDERISGLNDSKRLSAARREELAAEIKRRARAWAVSYVEPSYIDAHGMTASLRRAFAQAVSQIEDAGLEVDLVLLDGNPLHFDAREANVVKGDAKCASIAAASIVAKVDRDALMREYAARYPAYHFEKCKGYASPEHIRAIREHGLCPLHRASFCSAFVQDTLF